MGNNNDTLIVIDKKIDVMTKFAENLLNGEGGLNYGFLNTCFNSLDQLKHNLEKHIHFQITEISAEMPSFLVIRLNYGSFVLLYKFYVSNSSNRCGGLNSRKIDRIELLEIR